MDAGSSGFPAWLAELSEKQPLYEGEPTPAEVELGIGVELESVRRSKRLVLPDESTVLAIAGKWSIDPTSIDDNAVAGSGIFGVAPVPEGGKALVAALAKIPEAFEKYRR